VRSFACKGLFIKLKRHGSKAARTVILTSASLVRSHDDDKIDNTLKVGAPYHLSWSFKLYIRWLDELTLSLQIEVFLPPNQRGSGTLELYNLNYNIAIVSVKNFHAVCAEDIFCRVVQNPSEKSSSYRP